MGAKNPRAMNPQTTAVSYHTRTCVCDFIPQAQTLVLASIPISRHLIQKHISLRPGRLFRDCWLVSFTCSTVYWKWQSNRQAIHDLTKSAQHCTTRSIPALDKFKIRTHIHTIGWIAFASVERYVPVVSPGFRTLTIFLLTNRLLSTLRSLVGLEKYVYLTLYARQIHTNVRLELNVLMAYLSNYRKSGPLINLHVRKSSWSWRERYRFD